MEGARDPDCRRPFRWDYEQDPKRVALRDYYKKLAAARHAAPALRTGSFRTVHAEGTLFGYVRSGAGEDYLVALNAGRQAAEMPVDLAAWGGKVTARDVLGGGTESWSGTTTVKLPAEGGRLFKLTRGAGGAVGSK
jgi:glycosidase